MKDIDKTKVFDYLDDLRESGTTNMFGAVPYIREEFAVNSKTAQKLLSKWMRQYNHIKWDQDK